MRDAIISALIVAMLAVCAQAQQTEIPAAPEEKPEAVKPPEKAEEEPRVEVKGPLALEKMVFCMGVEEREPVGEGEEFPAETGRLYCWTNIASYGDSTSIEHVWYLNGEEKARVELPVRYPRNRVWSYKTIPPEWAGEWMVRVMTAEGMKLGEKSCTVK